MGRNYHKNRGTELLAPAGSFASVVAAVNAGADAIYMGGKRFGARAYAESAASGEEDMLLQAIQYCHLFGVKVYMTVNTLFKDNELKELFSYIRPYYEAGVDALIVQDLGAVRCLKQWFPDLELHASTQMTITGTEGARLASELGLSRVVLARELQLKQIRSIYQNTGVEIEAFVHGAMCYSYSGACFMSSLLGGRSGNRGRCAGTCRLCYEAGGKKAYYLSLKDMNTLEYLPELIEAGVYSMKIEGRMKSPLYTAGVVSVYRKYLDLAEQNPSGYKVDPKDQKLLKELFDRGGTSSYLYQHNGRGMLALGEKAFREPDEGVLKPVREQYLDRNRQIGLDAWFYMRAGEAAQLMLTDDAGLTISVLSENTVSAAAKRPITEEEIRKQLRKTGGTCFSIRECRMDIEGELFLPVKELNALRRRALAEYEEAKLNEYRRKTNHTCIS